MGENDQKPSVLEEISKQLDHVLEDNKSLHQWMDKFEISAFGSSARSRNESNAIDYPVRDNTVGASSSELPTDIQSDFNFIKESLNKVKLIDDLIIMSVEKACVLRQGQLQESGYKNQQQRGINQPQGYQYRPGHRGRNDRYQQFAGRGFQTRGGFNQAGQLI